MAEHPGDSRRSLDNTAEHQLSRRECGIKQESDQRRQPIFLHRLHADGMRRMNEHYSSQFVCLLPKRPETLLVESHPVNIAEYHSAAKTELAHRTFKFNHRGGRIV